MRIQHNIAALNSHRQLTSNNSSVAKNLEKLSSGYRINRAGDDAAGLAISEKMRAQITGLNTASKNAQDGISLVQTAEGALTEVHSMLNRMTELAGQAANGTYQDEVDRENAMKELDSLKSEVDRISDGTNFNGIKLLDGSMGGGKPGTAGSATFTGSSIAKFQAASQTGMGLDTDLTTLVAAEDYFSIDGQKLKIDWTKGDAASIATLLTKDFAGTEMTPDEAKDVAGKLTNLFNDAIKEQGLKGSVKITSDGTNLILASTNKGADSEFSYVGAQTPGDGDTITSVGSAIFGGTTTDAAVISKASMVYNGETIAAGSTFTMNINGVESVVTIADAITKGDTLDSTLSDTLQGYIQTAVDNYNTQKGLTAGVKDTDSGLTGLTTTEFTASFNKDGQLSIKYTGDVEDVNFKFGDIGDKTIAASLGLGSGSSSSGGGGGLTLQIGDTADAFNQLNVSIGSMSTAALGLGSIDIGTQDGAKASIDVIKKAINSVSSTRGDLGAIQNRLEHTINNLGVTAENMTAAESRIRDVDMAQEMMNFTKNNILTQASQSMLAQANQLPQGVLQLLQ